MSPAVGTAAVDLLDRRRVTRVRRLRHIVRGSVFSTTMPVELRFDDGSFALLEPAGDGEQLRTSPEEWAEMFPPGKPDLDSYVARHGKPEAIDVSAEEPYSGIVGAEVRAVAFWTGRKVTGVDLIGPAGGFSVRVEFDEVEVYPLPPSRDIR